MKRWIAVFIAAASIVTCGCATRRAVTSSAPTTAPATQPLDAVAMLRLDQIEPRPVLAQPQPTTQSSPAPLEAIALFAKARDTLLQGQRYSAINDIEKAIVLDPHSFELHYALGRAYLGVGTSMERAITAFETAARIKPNDLDVQVELGRAYQAKNDLPKAIEHFRLARLTDEYGTDDALAATVDYRLAVALQQRGYTRAALDSYASLLNRLEHPAVSSRGTPEINYLLSRPELVYDEMGKLAEKLGDYPSALRAYQQVAEAQPSVFELQGRVVATLLKMKRNADAVSAAAALVRKYHANPQSIALLREVHEKTGSPGAFADALRRLYRENPNDRSILFALAGTLASTGQFNQARDLLERGIETHHGDVEVVRRLYSMYADMNQVGDAARLIIRVSAAYPDVTSELEPLFMDLMRFSRKNSLRLVALEKIDVPSDAQAAKQFWIWRGASSPMWSRPTAARTALEQSAKATPPFDASCRAQLNAYFDRADLDDAAKVRQANALIESVQARGRPDLAAELRGILHLQTDKPDQAVEAFEEALRLSPPRTPSPDLQFERALAVLRTGNTPRFEQLMWKLLSDRPRYDTAYRLFYNYYKQNNADSQAANLINIWLSADPNNLAARLLQINSLIEQRRGEEALSQAQKLFEQNPDDRDVVGTLIILKNAAGQLQQAIDILEAERGRRPTNRVVVEVLLDIYAQQKRPADATRIIDAARAAVADDPDLLYYVAHLYQRIDQPQVTEQVLEDVLKLDPKNPQAGNDLGYSWADTGRNLEKAESLIRIAVTAEPDNPSYLDSLGWVLYKQSNFEGALKLLEQASEPAQSADPVVLDHRGDALYRLNRPAEAQRLWRQSLERIGQDPQRKDFIELRLVLQNKLRSADAGQPVNVAPIVETAANKDQAKN